KVIIGFNSFLILYLLFSKVKYLAFFSDGQAFNDCSPSAPCFALAKALSSRSVARIFTFSGGKCSRKRLANLYGSSPVEQAALQMFICRLFSINAGITLSRSPSPLL